MLETLTSPAPSAPPPGMHREERRERYLDNWWLVSVNFGRAVAVEDDRSLRIGRVKMKNGYRQKDLEIGVHMYHLDRPL